MFNFNSKSLQSFLLGTVLVLSGCDVLIPSSSSSSGSSIPSSSIDLYQEWANGSSAQDFNGDDAITLADFDIWTAYLSWRDTNAAEDLNDDRKINVSDYLIWDGYNDWKFSEDAIDMNADRVINLLDYLAWQTYSLWLESDNASDINKDEKIDILDYEMFLNGNEFQGNYIIDNYQYVGPNLRLLESNIAFKDLAEYLEYIALSIDKDGVITASFPLWLKNSLKGDFQLINDVFSNMTIARISQTIVTIDTEVILYENVVAITFYLSKITNGFTTSIELEIQGQEVFFSFDILNA
jgi:hypothetical protein